MPLMGPLTEQQKELFPIVNEFLGRADIQALHNIVDKHIRDTEKLQGTFERLQGSAEKLQHESEELRASNEKNNREIEKLQSTVDNLRGTIHQFQGANEELRLVNAKLQNIPEEMIEKVTTIEKNLKFDLDNVINNLESKTRTACKDLSNRVGQLHNDTRAVLKDLHKQMHQYDARQQDNEQNIEQLADMIHGPLPPLDLQDPSQELYQDQYAPPNHHPQKRHHAYDHVDRVDESADPHYGERSKRHALDREQDDGTSRPTISSKQTPSLARQDAVRVGVSNAQRPTTREALTLIKNQPEVSGVSNTNEVNPRFDAIKAHYNTFKAKFSTSQPKDQRNFIWKFIEGSGDDEFCSWFQEHLLGVLPPDKVTRSSRKSRNGRGRIIALNRSLTWEEVRHVVRDIPRAPPQFLQ